MMSRSNRWGAGDAANLAAWFQAGVAAVGIGRNLIKQEYLDGGDWQRPAARTAEALALIQEIRGER